MTIPTQPLENAPTIDPLLPAGIARACENAGVNKAGRDAITLLILGTLAGAFIAFGAVFMTVVLTDTDTMPWGVSRALAGLVFSLGLILVVICGAELFTGDALMVIAFASGRISFSRLLRAWALVYAGNVGGALATAVIVFLAGHYAFHGGAVGKTALVIASGKAALPAMQLFFLAVLCNVLVCLAVWMSFAARNIADKVLVIVPPIAAFVAAGFEHSIANLYLLPYGLAIKETAPPEFWLQIHQTASDYAALSLGSLIRNIGITTIGNLLGGSLLVGTVYWFVYLRPSTRPKP